MYICPCTRKGLKETLPRQPSKTEPSIMWRPYMEAKPAEGCVKNQELTGTTRMPLPKVQNLHQSTEVVAETPVPRNSDVH